MFKITNNNINITRGETATYDAVFKHSDGTPLILDKNLISDDKSIYGLFSVKLSLYDEDAVFRVPMNLDDLATFDTSADIIDIGDETFDNTYVPDSEVHFEDTENYKYIEGTQNQIKPTDGNGFIFKSIRSNVLYYYNGSDGKFYVIDQSTKKWKPDNLLTQNSPGRFFTSEQHGIWYSGGNTYFSGKVNISGSDLIKTYKIDDTNTTSPFTEITFSGDLQQINDGRYIWDDGTNTYYTTSQHSYIIDVSNGSITEVDLSSNLRGDYVFKDANGNVFYVSGTTAYKWNTTTSKWVATTTNKTISRSTYPRIYTMYGKTYAPNSYVLVSTTNGLVWDDVENDLNFIGTGWQYGTTWYCTSNTQHRVGVVDYSARKSKLYKRTIGTVPYYYTYVGNSDVVTEDDFEEYEFRLVFPFPYSIMKTLQPKVYKYEIALVGGTMTAPVSGQEPIDNLPMDIDFKQYLVEFKDFKVEGSLSE